MVSLYLPEETSLEQMFKKLKLDELNRPELADYQEMDKIPVVLILDNIRSAHNVGSIFRTSDAFLVEKIYLGGITAVPPHKEIRKTALGATESVVWEAKEDVLALVNELKENGYQIGAVEQTIDSTSLSNFRVNAHQKYALIVGNEVDGVSQDLINVCHDVIEIPQSGTKHSLNVSVCTGIVLWHFHQAFL